MWFPCRLINCHSGEAKAPNGLNFYPPFSSSFFELKANVQFDGVEEKGG